MGGEDGTSSLIARLRLISLVEANKGEASLFQSRYVVMIYDNKYRKPQSRALYTYDSLLGGKRRY